MDSQEILMTGFFSGIILMAVFHGILLASIFLFHKNFNAKSNNFLALSILGICLILAYEFIYWHELEDTIPNWLQFLPLYIRTIIPIGILYFVIFLIHPEHQLSKLEKMGFVVIGVELLSDLVHIPTYLFIEDTENIAIMENLILLFGWFLSIVASAVFLPLALHKINHYQKLLYENYSTTSNKSLAWLRNFILLVLSLTILSFVSFIQYVFGYSAAGEFTFGIVTIGLILLLFWVGYSIILKYSWFQIVPFKEEEKELTNNKLSSKTNAYHQKLLDLIEDEKLFEDSELTLDRLSEHLQISSGYLSQIINEKEDKNFFEFVNYYRIEAVKKRLLDEAYNNYTIMGIAMESGFKSKSTFNSVFKKFTGHTPSAFKRMHM